MSVKVHLSAEAAEVLTDRDGVMRLNHLRHQERAVPKHYRTLGGVWCGQVCGSTQAIMQTVQSHVFSAVDRS